MKLGEIYSIVECVQNWGNAASIALLDPACKIFRSPGVAGIIGYKIVSKCAIVFGDPVCPPANIAELTHDFHAYCHQIKKRVIYIAASQHFMSWALQIRCRIALAVGDEIILNPQANPCASKGKNASSLRNKYSFSIKQGIVVKEYTGNDEALEKKIEAVGKQWLESRKGPQVCLLRLDIFAERSNKRWFYAEYKGEIVGVLMLNRINAYGGWVMNMLMLSGTAPTTTSEFLLLSTFDMLRAEGCSFFSIGTSPTVQLHTTQGLGRASRWIVRRAYALAKKIFKLSDRQRYWKKFSPQLHPTYVLFSSNRLGFYEILGIMRALNVKG